MTKQNYLTDVVIAENKLNCDRMCRIMQEYAIPCIKKHNRTKY